MLTKRMIKIIEVLNLSKKPKSSREICVDLGITSRTLRNDVKEANKIIENYGFKIQSKHGVGYILNIKDEELYYSFIENEMQNVLEQQFVIPNYPEDRIDYIIRKLLIINDYITVESLRDELFVSRSTLDSDIKTVREKLSFFHLGLEVKPSYGIKIIGSEFHRRSCISMYYFSMDETKEYYNINNLNQNKIYRIISKVLYNVMEEKSFRLTHLGYENLIVHLVIAISRLKISTQNDSENFDNELLDTHEFKVSELLCERLENEFNVTFPLMEKIYIAMHLSGKQASQYLDPSMISMDDYDSILTKFFREIKRQFNIDLSSDFNLLTSLILHFQPMKNRIKYKINLQNPLLEQIKKENPLAFDISVVMVEILELEWEAEISEDEIGYIALHIALSIETYETEVNKKNILIVCASGVGSSQILHHKVLSKFRESIEVIEVVELYALENMDISNFDVLLSTVPLEKEYDIPTIYVKYFLSDKNIFQIDAVINEKIENDNIQQFFSKNLFFADLEAKKSEDIILEMCTKIRKVLNLPENFEEEVIKRENYAATEYGNNVAIPHPMQPITDETFVAIGILPKSVLWENAYVKYVFLLSLSKNNSESVGYLHESLASFIMDRDSLAKFDRSPTIDTFNKIIYEHYKSNEGNDLDSIFN